MSQPTAGPYELNPYSGHVNCDYTVCEARPNQAVVAVLAHVVNHGEATEANGKLFAAAPTMRDLLNDIHNWLVCSCIATPEDMAQSFEGFEQQISELLEQLK